MTGDIDIPMVPKGVERKDNKFEAINPTDWTKPTGYNNGMLAPSGGATLFIAGQIGWDKDKKLVSPEFSIQFDQALSNVIEITKAAGGKATNIGKLTIYVTDKQEYISDIKAVGTAYRKHMGKHFPAMALVEVKALLEAGAKVEIEAIAIIYAQQSLLDLIKLKKPEYSNAELGLGFCEIGDFKTASELFLAGVRENRSIGQLKDDLHPSMFSKTNRVKLLHDIDQFHFLQEKGVLGFTYEPLVKAYLDILRSAPENSSEAELFDIPLNAPQEFLAHYNRLIYLDQPTLNGKKALNHEIDWTAIDLAICENSNALAVVDDLLTKEALSLLRQFCLLSTIWLQIDSIKELYTTIFNGFACPLIFQIAHEFRCALPNLLANRPLINGWAIKYLGASSDVGIHADEGKISINFWITPDEANLTSGTGGLRIWERHLPNEYFQHSRERQKVFVEEALTDPDIKSTAIAYKYNRAIIFCATLAHQTEPFLFSHRYVDRRINITLLFGPIQ
jgi:enamine deaminase RidA (YjgF/YER057c/UK114 family)